MQPKKKQKDQEKPAASEAGEELTAYALARQDGNWVYLAFKVRREDAVECSNADVKAMTMAKVKRLWSLQQ